MTSIQNDETRDLILRAATKRILHYGYAKTTIAEIARECDMSAGNIYRFFNSKLDIAEAMARRYMETVFQEYGDIARDTSRPAMERLHNIFSSELHRGHDMASRETKTLEIARVMADNRPHVAVEQVAQARVHIETILSQGLAAGEFTLNMPIPEVASALQTAMYKFLSPESLGHTPLAQLEEQLEAVFKLISNGLTCK